MIGSTKAMDALLGILEVDPQALVRNEAAMCIGGFRTSQAEKVLRDELIQAPDDRTRAGILSGLTYVRDEAVPVELVELAIRTDPATAVWRLERFHTMSIRENDLDFMEGCMTTLLAQTTDEGVRREAAALKRRVTDQRADR